MADLLWLPLAAWLLWCAGNVALFLLGAWLARPNAPHFNGFTVFIPWWYAQRLSDDELVAVIQHELGHKHLRHVWKNLARRCVFLRYTPERHEREETEADDYCRRPLDLAAALRKTSSHPFDLWRAERLEKKHLAGGMPASTTQQGSIS